jgi:sulfur carrier protein ThiS
MQNTKTIFVNIQGEGIEAVTINEDTTVADVVNSSGLHRFGITVDDVVIHPDNWATHKLWNSQEMWATEGAKGA